MKGRDSEKEREEEKRRGGKRKTKGERKRKGKEALPPGARIEMQARSGPRTTSSQADAQAEDLSPDTHSGAVVISNHAHFTHGSPYSATFVSPVSMLVAHLVVQGRPSKGKSSSAVT